jgi:DNA invertase Pin-like site-specific DNA recombinase
MNGQRIGYIRVSSFDQNPDRRLESIQVGRTFTDKASGKDTRRPQLEALLGFARDGDTVIVNEGLTFTGDSGSAGLLIGR